MSNKDHRKEERRLAKDKSLWKELHYEISRILWESWDPIGVNDHPQALDEYDRYAMGVVIRLEQGADTQEVDDYLWESQTFSMGLELPERAHTEAVAVMCVAAVKKL